MSLFNKKGKNRQAPSRSKKKTPGWVAELRYGQSISLEFFRANAWLIMVIVVVVIALMGLRYKTRTRLEEIKQLTSELQLAESTMLDEKSKYMTLVRETEMKKMVQERGLPLEFQEQPPYILSGSK